MFIVNMFIVNKRYVSRETFKITIAINIVNKLYKEGIILKKLLKINDI